MAENGIDPQAAALAEEILRFTGSQAARISPHMYGKGIPKPSPDPGRKSTDHASGRSPANNRPLQTTFTPSSTPSKTPGPVSPLALQHLRGQASQPPSVRKGETLHPPAPSTLSANPSRDVVQRQMSTPDSSSSTPRPGRDIVKSNHNKILLFLVANFPDPNHLEWAKGELKRLKRARENRSMSLFWRGWSHRSRTRSSAEVLRFTKSFHQVRVYLQQWRLIVGIARDLKRDRKSPPADDLKESQPQIVHASSPAADPPVVSSTSTPGDVRRRISPAIIARFGEPISPRSTSPLRRSEARNFSSSPASQTQIPPPDASNTANSTSPASVAPESGPVRTLAYPSASPANGGHGWVRAQAASLSAKAGPRDLSPPPGAQLGRSHGPLYTLPVPQSPLPTSTDSKTQIQPHHPPPSQAQAASSHPPSLPANHDGARSSARRSVSSPGLQEPPSWRSPIPSPPGSGPPSNFIAPTTSSSHPPPARTRPALPHFPSGAGSSPAAGRSSANVRPPGAASQTAFAAKSSAPAPQRNVSPTRASEGFEDGLGAAGWNQYLALLDGKVNNLDALVTNLAARLQKAAKAGQEAPGMYLLQLHNEDLLARNETLRQHLYQAQQRERWLSGQLKRMSQLASGFHAQNAQVYRPQSPPIPKHPLADERAENRKPTKPLMGR